MGCVTRADLFLDVDQKTSSLITHKNRSKKCLTMVTTKAHGGADNSTDWPNPSYISYMEADGRRRRRYCMYPSYTPHYSVDTGLVGKCAVVMVKISINIYCTNRQEMAVLSSQGQPPWITLSGFFASKFANSTLGLKIDTQPILLCTHTVQFTSTVVPTHCT
eukprot:scaffold4532_cov99-Skeletonema_menzelii.AAC.1